MYGDEDSSSRLRFLHEMNERHASENPLDTELSARTYSYELAYRMQNHATEAIDISSESNATKRLYGVDEEPTDYFGRQALMALGVESACWRRVAAPAP